MAAQGGWRANLAPNRNGSYEDHVMAYLDKCTIDRFMSKVDVRGNDECWPWTASKNHLGYGKFKHRGTVVNASRIALSVKTGAPLYGLVACHTCDNPTCCNPAHLYAGTQSDNMRDRWARFVRPLGTSQS